MNELLIIIPAYNEESNIEPFLEKLEQVDIPMGMDILVIDDGSTDHTKDIVRKRNHKIITQCFNLGYGSGLQTGYKYAAQKGYQYVIQMDADGQHDARNVETILKALITADEEGNTPDIVLGSRFVKGSTIYPISFVKKIAYCLFRILIRLFTGKKIQDPTTGLQGLNRKAFGYYAGYNHFDDKYPDAILIMQMILLGFRVIEIPSVMHARTEGVSMHSGLKPIIYMFRMMFSMIAVWIRIRLFHVDEGAVEDEYNT